MRVLVDQRAYGDLDQIHAWIARDRPAAARSVIERILAALDLLQRHPYAGRRGRVRGTYEWVVTGLPYIIVFEIDSRRDELKVTGVFHGARRPGRR
jgi:toxin ParE1/3/4